MEKLALTFPILKFFGGAELSAIRIANHLSKTNKIDLIYCGDKIHKEIRLQISKKINLINLKSKNLILNYLIRNYILIAQCYIIFYLNVNGDKYKKIISTSGEIVNNKKCYQLINFPFYSLNFFDYLSLGTKSFEIHKFISRFLIISICRIIFNINSKSLKRNVTFCNSKWTAKKYKEVYNYEKNIFYNYCTFTLKSTKNISFKKFEKKKNNFVILGRVTRDKKIHHFIKIFKKLSDNLNKNNLQLTIIGPIPDNRYFEKCKALAQGYNVIFTGFVNERKKINIMNNSKYGIHLFRNEHFGMAPCEMQNNNMIVFVYKNGGVIEFIRNKRQHFLNFNQLYENIFKMILQKNTRLISHKLMLKNKKLIKRNSYFKKLDKILDV